MLPFHLKTGLLLAAFAAIVGCTRSPDPPEVFEAQSQEEILWRSGAPQYSTAEYTNYVDALKNCRDTWNQQKDKLPWFRDDETVSSVCGGVLAEGERILAMTRTRKASEAKTLLARIRETEEDLKVIQGLRAQIKDRRLAFPSLMKSEILLTDAKSLQRGGAADKSRANLDRADAEIREMTRALGSLTGRYTDRNELKRWRSLAESAIASSRKGGGEAIVVNKLERRVTLYRAGKVLKSYDAGLGFHYLSDKLQAGDKATPEGRYVITRKNPHSRFYKALLIDYPNDEDRKTFREAKRRKDLPPQAAIGGLIELHGHGKDGMTNGCIALDDRDIDELYTLVQTGTPVIIIGTLDPDNIITTSLRHLHE